jgi:antitoxin (DNA-binding transcriptional repressor) of toxin-antitoxin stability system
MDRVAEGRETYVITKRGKPVARLVPVGPPRNKSIFGCMADQMEIVGDIEKPLFTDEQWKQFAADRSEQWRAAERLGPPRRDRSKARVRKRKARR